MSSLTNFLENLRPGGASSIPRSRFQQNLTEDSELDISDETSLAKTKTSQKSLKKKLGSIRQHSSEPSQDSFNKTLEIIVRASPIPRNKRIEKKCQTEAGEFEKIWRDVKDGKNGHLTLGELEKICIYLEINEFDQNFLKTVFKKTDIDFDDRVSLLELSKSLKQCGQMTKKNETNEFPQHFGSGLFSTLDPDKKGYCKVERIQNFWVTGGLLNANEVLQYFDLHENDIVNLDSLSKALEQEMIMGNLDAVSFSGFICFQKERVYYKATLNMILTELTKIIYGEHVERNESRSSMLINPTKVPDLCSNYISRQKKAKSLIITKNNEYKTLINELKISQGETKSLLKDVEQESLALSLQNKELKNRIEELEAVNMQQTEEMNRVLESNRKMTEGNLKSENVSEETKIDMKKVEASEIQNSETEKQENKLEEKYKQLQTENESLNNKLISLNAKVEIAINREKQYQIKLKKLEANRKKMIEMNENFENIQKELTKENIEYKRKLSDTQYEVEKTEKENKHLISSLEFMEDELRKSRNYFRLEQENFERKLQEMEDQMKTFYQIKSELASSRDELKAKETIIIKLEEANDRLSVSIRNAISKLQLFSRQNVDLNSKHLIAENIQIQKENSLLEEQINELQRKLLHTNTFQGPTASDQNIKSFQPEINHKNIEIMDVEEKFKKKSSNSISEKSKSLKSYDFLQFQYDELNKKYITQLEQVEKTDSLLQDLYESNTKLLTSINQMEIEKDSLQMKIKHLEEEIKSLRSSSNRQNIL